MHITHKVFVLNVFLLIRDTSSGKTSLVNTLVEERLVTPKVLSATLKICRIRNSETYAIEVLDVNGKVIEEKTTFNTLRKMTIKLDKYTNKKEGNAGMNYIDIYCPLGNLDVKVYLYILAQLII